MVSIRVPSGSYQVSKETPSGGPKACPGRGSVTVKLLERSCSGSLGLSEADTLDHLGLSSR